MKYVFGVDVGGTSVKTALVTESGELVHKVAMSTDPERGSEYMIARLQKLLSQSCQEAGIAVEQVEAVGVGVPAFLNQEQTTIVEAVNLGWHNVPLQQQFQSILGLPVVIENDANVAALGESWRGAGQGANNVLCITLGTGVGGGVVLDGKLLRGANGMAGEIGHLVVQPGGNTCNCGHQGCLETLASATAIVRRAKEFQELKRISSESAIEGAAVVFELATQGDAGAKQVVEEAAYWLGYGLSLAATVTNPNRIVIGGGVSYAGEMLLEPVRRIFRDFALARVEEMAVIVQAKLGNDAGVIGAARLAIQSLG